MNYFLICLFILDVALVGKALSESISKSKSYSYNDNPWTISSVIDACPINGHNSNDMIDEGSRRNARLGVVEIAKAVVDLKPVNGVMQMDRTGKRKDDVQTHQLEASSIDHSRITEDSMKTVDNVPDHTRITKDSMKTVDSVPDHARIKEDSMTTADSVPDHTRITENSMKTVDSVPDNTRIKEDTMETVDSVPDHTMIIEDSMKKVNSVPDHTRIIEDSMKKVDSVPDHTRIKEDSMKTVDSVPDHTRTIEDSMKTVYSVPDHTRITEDSMKTVESVPDHTRIEEDSMKTVDSVPDHTRIKADSMKTVDSVPDHTRIEEDTMTKVDNVPDHTRIKADSMQVAKSVPHGNDYVRTKEEENLLCVRDDPRMGDDSSRNEPRQAHFRGERFKDENRILGENMKDRKPNLKEQRRIYDIKKAQSDRKVHIDNKVENKDTAFHIIDKVRYDVEKHAESETQDVHPEADETEGAFGEIDNKLDEAQEPETFFELKIKELAKLICQKNIHNGMKLKELQRENSLQRLRINRMKNDRVEHLKEIEKLTQKVQTQKEETRSYHHDGNIEKEVTRASFHEAQSKDNIFEKRRPFVNDETLRKQAINEPTDDFEFPSIGTVLHICTLIVVMYVIVRLTKVQRTVMIYQKEIRRINQAVTQCQSELENIRQKLYDVTTAQSATETPETITVVSFQGGSAQMSHKQMAESVIKRKEIKELLDEGRGTWDVKQVLVNTASDVEKIVASKFILIFIDHNDAMKILEDPNSKIEKVKSKTVESAIKMSDAVIIVYCWDTKSKDLDLGTLYSPRLEKSLSHPLLLELRKQQSIYSIYKSFTYFQRCHLIKKLQSILKDHSREIVLVPPKQNLHVQTSTSLYVR